MAYGRRGACVGKPLSGPRIFVNYRREDSSGESGRLYDRLVNRYGTGQVFRDREAIAPGTPFPRRIFEAIAGSCVFIAVIGPRWLRELQARSTDAEDYVRREIKA